MRRDQRDRRIASFSSMMCGEVSSSKFLQKKRSSKRSFSYIVLNSHDCIASVILLIQEVIRLLTLSFLALLCLHENCLS